MEAENYDNPNRMNKTQPLSHIDSQSELSNENS